MDRLRPGPHAQAPSTDSVTDTNPETIEVEEANARLLSETHERRKADRAPYRPLQCAASKNLISSFLCDLMLTQCGTVHTPSTLTLSSMIFKVKEVPRDADDLMVNSLQKHRD